MTDKLALIKEVMDAAYFASESWELIPPCDTPPDSTAPLGTDVAYLVHAIVDDSVVQWDARHSGRMFFSQLLGCSHPAFNYIEYPPDATPS
jgi:hypothetical protein